MQIFKKKKTIIHCCTQKTGSQWFVSFLSSILKESGNKYNNYTFVDYRKSVIFRKSPFKEPSYKLQKKLYTFQNDEFGFNRLKNNALYSSFYVGSNILNFLKSNQSRVFFILRDPRDLVVSWYYSAKYSHTPSKDINRVRSVLMNCSFEEGIKFSIDQMVEFGLFDGVKGWMSKTHKNDFYRIYLFEDFVEQYKNFCLDLIAFLDLKSRNVSYSDLINKHSYEKYSNGRIKGEADNKSHYRSASINQWKNEFNEELIEYFKLKTNDLGRQYDIQKNQFKIQ